MLCFLCRNEAPYDHSWMCERCIDDAMEHVDQAMLQALRKGGQQIVDDRGIKWEIRGNHYCTVKGQKTLGRKLDALEARCSDFYPLA